MENLKGSLNQPLNLSKEQAVHWFSNQNLNDIQVLYVYGLDAGWVYKAASNWLQEDNLRSLVFLEENPLVVGQLAHSERGQSLLKDPQVAVHLIDDLLKLDEIVLPYSLFSFEVSHLAHKDYLDKIKYHEIKSIIAFFADYHRSAILGYSQGGLFFYNNFFNNILKLPRSYNAKGLIGAFKDVPAIICGAGPSLDKNINVLRKLHSRALIMAGATALNALNAKNVIPHVGVGIDPNPEQMTRLIMNKGYEMPFFYRNRIHHRALDMVHSDKIYVSGSTGFNITDWVEERLGIKQAVKDNELSEGYNVLNFAVSLAHKMGCNPIIMVGVDLAYSQGLSYSSGISSHPLYDRKKHFQTKASHEELLDKKDIYGQPARTLWKWVRESLWYGLFAQKHPDILVINATEGGIGFPDVQNMTLTEVAAQYLIKHYDIPTILHGEIQNSRWPPEIDDIKISRLLKQLSKSLNQCEEICRHIEESLSVNNPVVGEPVDKNYALVNELVDDLRKEDAFEAILKDIESSYLRFSSLERQRLNNENNTLSKGERDYRQNALDLVLYGLLKKTARSNQLLIDFLLKRYEDMKTVLIPPKNLNNTLEKNANETYAFDGQYLTLYDPELELNYIETFPTDAYLRKERMFYSGGNVKREQFYQGMFLHGPSTFFGRDGKILARAWFINGQQQGKMRTYYANGQIHSIQRFFNGLKQGTQEYYYSDGTLKTLLQYQLGVLHDENKPACLIYHPNGQLARQQYFVQGNHEGVECIWNEQGLLEAEVSYLHDQPVGFARKWHSNGQLACEIEYDDKSHRVSAHYWNQEGLPIAEEKNIHESYFETLSHNAAALSDSLEDVFSKVSVLIPTVLKSPKISEPNKIPVDFSEDLKELQKELEHLQELSQTLKQESGLENAQESGLNPNEKLAFDQQLLLKQRKMTEQMHSIDISLQNMLKEWLQNYEEDQK